ncbi:hypothetical protein [Clostridium sp.]|uniref:hypothetical protein n=1 Tax=Clostridium sp. TaxID=1506 RepID=UPI003D6CFDC5
MLSKNSLKKININVQYIVFIAMLGIVVCYFFINKNIFKETRWLILWSLVGVINISSIINSKYFKDDFSWKHVWKNVIYIIISTIVVVVGAIRIWV